MLPACICAISMDILCSNCFGSNVLSPFPCVHFLLTGFIEEVDDLSLDYLDDVLY